MSLISISETSATIRSGISVGSASTVISRVTCSSTPPSLTPGRDLGALELDRDLGLDLLVELDLLEVDVLEVAADRVELLLLDDDRDRGGALELEVEQRLAAGEDGADLAFPGLEGARVAAAAVDDAGHQALAPQAARAARAEVRAGSRFQGFASVAPSERERIEKRRRREPVAPFRPDSWPTNRRSRRAGSAARRSSARSSASRERATRGPRRPTSPAPRRAARRSSSSATSKPR